MVYAILALPLYLVWLLVCLLLAFIGLILPRKKCSLIVGEVYKVETICRIMCNKGLLSEKEYSFETTQVAPYYDQLTFQGYIFIMKPVMAFIKRYSYLDTLMMFLVRRWMRVHGYLIQGLKRPAYPYILLTYVSTSIARCVGRSLLLICPQSDPL